MPEPVPEMVERVARAIYEVRNGAGCTPWSRRETAHKEPYRKDACAAIASLRDPTKAMSDVGWETSEAADKEWRSCTPRQLWGAMIDAALGTHGKGEGR